MYVNKNHASFLLSYFRQSTIPQRRCRDYFMILVKVTRHPHQHLQNVGVGKVRSLQLLYNRQCPRNQERKLGVWRGEVSGFLEDSEPIVTQAIALWPWIRNASPEGDMATLVLRIPNPWPIRG